MKLRFGSTLSLSYQITIVIEPRALQSFSGGPIQRWFRHNLRHPPTRDDDVPLLPRTDTVVEAMHVNNDSDDDVVDIDMPGLVSRGDNGLLAAASLLCELAEAKLIDALVDGERVAVA